VLLGIGIAGLGFARRRTLYYAKRLRSKQDGSPSVGRLRYDASIGSQRNCCSGRRRDAKDAKRSTGRKWM